MTDAQVADMIAVITAHEDALARRRARILTTPLNQAILAVLREGKRPMRICEVYNGLRCMGIIEPRANLRSYLLTLERNGYITSSVKCGRWHFQIARESEGRA